MEGNNDIQLANVAVRDVKLSEREAEVEDMDRRGRVLMKGNEMQEYGGLKEKPAAAKVVTTLPFDNRTKAQHSTEIIGGITGEFHLNLQYYISIYTQKVEMI